MTRPDQHFPWTYDYCPYRTTDDKGEREIPCFEIVDSESRRVALTFEDATLELQEADARLLAAAPDLLQSLQRILAAHDSRNNGAVIGEAVLCKMFAELARAAIAKAKGGVS